MTLIEEAKMYRQHRTPFFQVLDKLVFAWLYNDNYTSYACSIWYQVSEGNVYEGSVGSYHVQFLRVGKAEASAQTRAGDHNCQERRVLPVCAGLCVV
mmetsp:Transcript_16930/g.27183  ORF Transcript_16930/g.27183 Transcript_16930/m.27183 type:complete len:97 (+) Transcript_16930:586-876(+)